MLVSIRGDTASSAGSIQPEGRMPPPGVDAGSGDAGTGGKPTRGGARACPCPPEESRGEHELQREADEPARHRARDGLLGSRKVVVPGGRVALVPAVLQVGR